MLDAALRSVADDLTGCLAGQSLPVTARGKVRADGTVEEIDVAPTGPAAACVASAVRYAHFEPTRVGGRFVRDLPGDPSAPPMNVVPSALDANRQADAGLHPDHVHLHAGVG